MSARRLDVIGSVDELGALPPESIVKTEDGTVACRFYDGVHGVLFGDDRPFKWSVLQPPALLLWHPDWSTR